ncbi:MAG: FHA domain-containing protein [Myxococcales bacterium]|nr:FHA domain-containing protein [Myxococcales bacterium]
MANFRLKLRETELDLPNGELTIGRGTECFLRINDELVSRRHARLLVTPNSVFFEDLGSRNGSRVNSSPVAGSLELKIGDEVEIGTQIFQLVRGAGRPRPPSATTPNLRPCRSCKRLMEARLQVCPLCGVGQRVEEREEGPTCSMTSFELLLGVGDKMLALGRNDEAEKMLGPRLRELASRAPGDLPGQAEVSEALRRGVRLAASTKRTEWYVWIFDFARLAEHPIEEAMLDELHAHMLAHKPAAGAALQAYLDTQTGDDDATVLRRRRLEALLRFCHRTDLGG